jgi:hypothetical protein
MRLNHGSRSCIEAGHADVIAEPGGLGVLDPDLEQPGRRAAAGGSAAGASLADPVTPPARWRAVWHEVNVTGRRDGRVEG